MMKSILMTGAMALVMVVGFTAGSINTSVPGWLSFQQAEASSYRHSVRFTSRRTASRY